MSSTKWGGGTGGLPQRSAVALLRRGESCLRYAAAGLAASRPAAVTADQAAARGRALARLAVDPRRSRSGGGVGSGGGAWGGGVIRGFGSGSGPWTGLGKWGVWRPEAEGQFRHTVCVASLI
nr:unnamed protein product [Digitaria exilis]